MRRHDVDLVDQLTSQNLSEQETTASLREFASVLGWNPSDRLRLSELDRITTAHLVVEHGLENSAVLSFVRAPLRYAELDFIQQYELIGISYNNLVDWHVIVEHDGVTFVYNRSDPPRVAQRSDFTNAEALRSRAFEQISGRRPNPNIPALDDALIETISYWRRVLSSELGHAISNDDLSGLINAIIFARAVEDNHGRYKSSSTLGAPALVTNWRPGATLREILSASIERFAGPADFLRLERLAVFDGLPTDVVRMMLADFYKSRFAPYRYDFSLISKHALSRIYEHYVSLLRLDLTAQNTLFPRLPKEEAAKSVGSIYTPQYIARFFARFLRQEFPSSAQALRVLDPACGSGIFLRTLLELECDPVFANSIDIDSAFANVVGIDVDPNAIEASRLSLALLHLILRDNYPSALNLFDAESMGFVTDNPGYLASFDAVLANPPFVSITSQPDSIRETLAAYLSDLAQGRLDLYLGFLKIAVDSLKPGGYGLFVLPHTFLLADSASGMRRFLHQECWIRVIADLSAIRVFGSHGIYVLLLIFQKRSAAQAPEPNVTVIKCQDLVGAALQDALQARYQETSFYSIYPAPQAQFADDRWTLLPPSEANIWGRLTAMPRLDQFMDIRQGMNTGADDVFIVEKRDLPKGDRFTLRTSTHRPRDVGVHGSCLNAVIRVFPIHKRQEVDG